MGGTVRRASAFRRRGRQGLLGPAVDEEYGGGGSDDFRHSAVLIGEFARAGASGLAPSLHNDIVGPYLTRLATEEQKRRRLPCFVSDGILADLVVMVARSTPEAAAPGRACSSSNAARTASNEAATSPR